MHPFPVLGLTSPIIYSLNHYDILKRCFLRYSRGRYAFRKRVTEVCRLVSVPIIMKYSQQVNSNPVGCFKRSPQSAKKIVMIAQLPAESFEFRKHKWKCCDNFETEVVYEQTRYIYHVLLFLVRFFNTSLSKKLLTLG